MSPLKKSGFCKTVGPYLKFRKHGQYDYRHQDLTGSRRECGKAGYRKAGALLFCFSVTLLHSLLSSSLVLCSKAPRWCASRAMVTSPLFLKSQTVSLQGYSVNLLPTEQVEPVRCSPCKHEDLSSIPEPTFYKASCGGLHR